MLLPQDSGSFAVCPCTPTLQVEGFCRLEGNRTGTCTDQGHGLQPGPRDPVEWACATPRAGGEGENFRPRLCRVGLRQHLLCRGISLLCLRLDPTNGDVVNMWGHPSGVTLELS